MANTSFGLTSNVSYGLSYLDLPGNRYVWNPDDTKHSNVILVGSKFHDSILLATLAISALSWIGLIAVMVAGYCGVARHKGVSQYLPFVTVWLPIFWMMRFFVIDIGNRVLHEMQKSMPWPYIAIDVGMVVSSASADLLLMAYLALRSPVQIKRNSNVAYWGLRIVWVLYLILSVGTIGTQIWNVFQQNDAADIGDTSSSSPSKRYVVVTSGGDDNSSSSGSNSDNPKLWLSMSLAIYQDLDTAASGMLLLFVIVFTLFAFIFVRRRHKQPRTSTQVSFAVLTLAASFVLRDSIRFIFALIYAQFNHLASLGIQLVFMVFNGLLTVALYASIVWVAVAIGREDDVESESTYSHPQMGGIEAGRYQGKPRSNVQYNPAPANDYSYYDHDAGNTRPFYRQ